ncbi:MAG: co-chaperone GroES [Candidatus Saccharibacteria bacterium]
MSTKIQPLAEYVVAEQVEAETKTASGIYLPDKAAEKPKIAKVIAVGKKVKEVQAKDKIIYGGYSHSDIKIDGREYMLIKEEDIYAVIK